MQNQLNSRPQHLCWHGKWGVAMKNILLTTALLALVACGTPQEQCIGAVTRDLRVVEGLITETQGNLARGYAFARVVETRPRFVDCTPKPTTETPNPRPRQCLEDVSETVTRPVAIDLNAEAAKLASLQTKRAQQASAATAAIAACQRQYPQ